MRGRDVLSLCSGIGGIDLGLERAGWQVRWQAEVDPYASKVLAKHWPEVPNLGDIRTVDWSTVGPVDLLCAGYPCQPFSLAGQRLGADDPRHLWPLVLDAVRRVRPRWALLENVPGHLSLGFGRVLGNLAEVGYDTEWDCIPAAAVGAPHRRDRVFIVAHAQRGELWQQPVGVTGRSGTSVVGDDGAPGHVADTAGGSGPDEPRCTDGEALGGSVARAGGRVVAGNPAEGVPLDGRAVSWGACAVADPAGSGLAHDEGIAPQQGRWRTPGRAGWWAFEPDVGRVADGFPGRVDRLRVLGNAVVPQVAEHLGRLIAAADGWDPA